MVGWEIASEPNDDVCSFLALSKSLEVGLSQSQGLQYTDLCSEMLSAESLVGRQNHARLLLISTGALCRLLKHEIHALC